MALYIIIHIYMFQDAGASGRITIRVGPTLVVGQKYTRKQECVKWIRILMLNMRVIRVPAMVPRTPKKIARTTAANVSQEVL